MRGVARPWNSRVARNVPSRIGHSRKPITIAGAAIASVAGPKAPVVGGSENVSPAGAVRFAAIARPIESAHTPTAMMVARGRGARPTIRAVTSATAPTPRSSGRLPEGMNPVRNTMWNRMVAQAKARTALWWRMVKVWTASVDVSRNGTAAAPITLGIANTRNDHAPKSIARYTGRNMPMPQHHEHAR
jgi:hypothetical protein